MTAFFNVILYQPILNLLVFIYNVIPGQDIGVAIIILTIIIKLLLYPFSLKSIHSQKALQEIQPKIEALKVEYKDKKDELARKMMELYKEEKVSPFSSCLPLLIQLPFLIAVFQVFRVELVNGNLTNLYPFIANPGYLNPVSLGFIDMAQPQILLAVITGGFQYLQMKMLNTKKPPIKTEGAKDENMMAIMNKQMLFMMPIMTVFIGASLPGGLVLYWLITTILTVLMQYFAFRKKKNLDVEVVDKNGSGGDKSVENEVVSGEVVEEKKQIENK
jgi:YidC/Oxa1 family membrane protein insertase